MNFKVSDLPPFEPDSGSLSSLAISSTRNPGMLPEPWLLKCAVTSSPAPVLPMALVAKVSADQPDLPDDCMFKYKSLRHSTNRGCWIAVNASSSATRSSTESNCRRPLRAGESANTLFSLSRSSNGFPNYLVT